MSRDAAIVLDIRKAAELIGEFIRNRLIHGYDDVDVDEVWATITRDIPALLGVLAKLDVGSL